MKINERSRQMEYTAIILQVPFDKEDMYVSKTYYHVRGINIEGKKEEEKLILLGQYCLEKIPIKDIEKITFLKEQTDESER